MIVTCCLFLQKAVITHAGCIAAGVGIAFSRLSVCLLSVCLFVRALKGKRLELSTPNFVHIYSIAVARHALTQGSKGESHTVTKIVTVARFTSDATKTQKLYLIVTFRSPFFVRQWLTSSGMWSRV